MQADKIAAGLARTVADIEPLAASGSTWLAAQQTQFDQEKTMNRPADRRRDQTSRHAMMRLHRGQRRAMRGSGFTDWSTYIASRNEEIRNAIARINAGTTYADFSIECGITSPPGK